ncbi:LINE-1 reverse transcriptase [Plakobranchus ocellatus]|uniref:LINE-1 reverse transcriptase n=1 Tax=Plakobranchus ocellatus TaxID=259542 RepID=A0AAV3YRR1_9GAST|nr:LINE-1 reverse transcriptase [Plakobranchus ocellatus]
MRKSLIPEISPIKFGLIPDEGTRNAIFTLSMLMERRIERQKDLHLCFIDYPKAFDKLRHVELFPMLEKLDIDGKDLRVIRNLNWNYTAFVRIEREHSDIKPIKRGVGQGCVMSPVTYIVKYPLGILMVFQAEKNGENLNYLRYADDTVYEQNLANNSQNF